MYEVFLVPTNHPFFNNRIGNKFSWSDYLFFVHFYIIIEFFVSVIYMAILVGKYTWLQPRGEGEFCWKMYMTPVMC